MPTLAEEVTAQVLDQRERAQSLNAVKLALRNAIIAREANAIGDFISPAAGLRIGDLESVVGQAERVAEVDAFKAVDLVYTNEVTRLRDELASVAAQRDELVTGVERLKRESEQIRDMAASVVDAFTEAERETLTRLAAVTAERDVALAQLPTAEHIVILRSDYERLIKSLPAGPRAVR